MIKNNNNTIMLMMVLSIFLAVSAIASATDGYILYDMEANNEITGLAIITNTTDGYNQYKMEGQNDFSIFYVKSAPEIVDLYIDGEFIGFTPAKIIGLSVGDHTIVFKKTGYRDYSAKITVTKGLGGKILGAMTSVNGALAEKSWAEVTTACNIPCKLYINNVLIGEGGMTVDLDLGSYNLKVLPIDRDHHSYNTVLDLKEAGDYGFNVYLASFEEYPSFENRLILTVHSEPSGAEVIMNGTSYGVTPLGIASISLDNRTVVLKKKGYLTKEVFVDQQHDRGTRYRDLTVELEPGIDPIIKEDGSTKESDADIASKITEAYASSIAEKHMIIEKTEAFDEYYQFNGTREGRLWGLFDTKYPIVIKVYADGSMKRDAIWYDFMVLDKPSK